MDDTAAPGVLLEVMPAETGYNVCIGVGAGAHLEDAHFNLLIGRNAGANLKRGLRNIIIGDDLQAPSEEVSDYINIGGHVFSAADATVDVAQMCRDISGAFRKAFSMPDLNI